MLEQLLKLTQMLLKLMLLLLLLLLVLMRVKHSPDVAQRFTTSINFAEGNEFNRGEMSDSLMKVPLSH